MYLLGTIINAAAILLGSTIGLLVPSIPERIKTTIMQGLSLAVILIGLAMALADTQDMLIIILSLVIGTLIGEWINIEGWLMRLGQAVEVRAKRLNQGQIADSFVAASLVFCVGSMAIVGAIKSGVQGDNRTLYAKSMLDGFSSIVFASTLGMGVALSAIPVLLYEGLIATIAYFAGTTIQNPAVIAAMSATGGLLIVAIGINILGIQKIRVGNMLPAMFLAAAFRWVQPYLLHLIHQAVSM